MTYIRQTPMNGYYCCRLVAVLNALRYHGRDTCHNTGHSWQLWVDECGCRLSDTPVPEKALKCLGVQLREISCVYAEVSRNLPVMVPFAYKKEFAHWALVVGAVDGIVDIANYKGHLSPEPLHTRKWDRLTFREGEAAYVVEIIDDNSISSRVPGKGSG